MGGFDKVTSSGKKVYHSKNHALLALYVNLYITGMHLFFSEPPTIFSSHRLSQEWKLKMLHTLCSVFWNNLQCKATEHLISRCLCTVPGMDYIHSTMQQLLTEVVRRESVREKRLCAFGLFCKGQCMVCKNSGNMGTSRLKVRVWIYLLSQRLCVQSQGEVTKNWGVTEVTIFNLQVKLCPWANQTCGFDLLDLIFS